jgi:hypothetical protein
MDVTQEKVQVNLEEAIAAIQAVTLLNRLDWKQIDFISNGIPVELIDISYDDWRMPPMGLDNINYLASCKYLIIPQSPEITEESPEDE